MSEENVDKTRDFIEAYNRRDFDAAIENFDPKVDWVLPPHQDFDSCRGPKQIIRFWEGLDETSSGCMASIRPCRHDERGAILAIVNSAAEAYRGLIPADSGWSSTQGTFT
jgi:SnoaL-like domain